jgi:hypothetical protein
MLGVDPELFIERVRQGERYQPRILAANLSQIVDLLGDQTAVVLALPTSNLRDFPPHFSMFAAPLELADRLRLEELVIQAGERMDDEHVEPRRTAPIWGDGSRMHAWRDYPLVVDPEAPPLGSPAAKVACEEPLALLDQALAIDDGYALGWYLRGTCLLHHDVREARRALVRARDLSPAMAPHQRAGTPLVDAISAFGLERGLPVVDLPAAFTARTELGITDGSLFVDNLHFSVLGHQAAAGAIADALDQLPVVRDGPPPDRAPDPEPAETVTQMELRRITSGWGLGLDAPPLSAAGVVGADEDEAPPVDLPEEQTPEPDEVPYLDDTGAHDRPGHEINQSDQGSGE